MNRLGATKSCFNVIFVFFFIFRRIEAQRRKERSEAHLYMDVQVLTEEAFCTWPGNDLFADLKHTHFKIQKKEKLKDATRIIAESFVSLLERFSWL